ncbi:MAG: UDP-N-acetylmuramoyl-L-alanyl-D-glutamate--2,6-diaminopimelate ligase [Pseudomonadota bacterium]
MASTRPVLTLQELLQGAAAVPEALADLRVRGMSQDSRRIVPGEIFVALRGAQHDGHDMLDEVQQAGAIAALTERPVATARLPIIVFPDLRDRLARLADRCYGHPSRSLHVTAVTGTNGKTTVSQLFGQLVRAAGYACGVIGTLGASLDGGARATTHTTPDAIALQHQLAAWAGEAVPFVAMEASSHALHQGRLDAIDVDTAVFTNLTRDHLDYHGDMHAYGEAKARLFRFASLRAMVLNAEDSFGASLGGTAREGVKVTTYGLARPGDVRASRIEMSSAGLRFRLTSPQGEAVVRSGLLGAFNLSNLLAATAAALEAGMPLVDIIAGAAVLRSVPGRMEPLRVAGAPLVVVDYAHTPDALLKVLDALKVQCQGRLIAVFGCGGDRDRGKRALMAKAVSSGADFAVITSDNPRGEDPETIVAEVAKSMTGAFAERVDRREAIRFAIGQADATDCVLIAGKGHEDYQEIAGRRVPFSDLAVARDFLGEMAA